MTTAMLPTADFDTAGADEAAGLPGWLYRSEAFAEDLLPAEADAGHALPGLAGLRGRALLYPATLVLALACTLPAALALA